MHNNKLCIFFNNVDHIRNTLSECSKWLVLDPFYDSLEKKQKIGKKCKSLIEKIIQEADVEMQNCTNSIMLDIIAEKVRNDICSLHTHLMIVHVLLQPHS